MTLFIILLILLIPIIIQINFFKCYNNLKNLNITKDTMGQEVIKNILEKNHLKDTYVVITKGFMNNYYDSKRNVIRLSKEIFESDNLASLIIASFLGYKTVSLEKNNLGKVKKSFMPVIGLLCLLSYIITLYGIFEQSLNIIVIGLGILVFIIFYNLLTIKFEISICKDISQDKLFNTKEIKEASSLINSLKYISITLPLRPIIWLFKMFKTH